MWFVVWSSVVIFTLVATVAALLRLDVPRRPGDESDGPPIHGNTTLEIVWTVVPTILLAVVAVWAYLVLSRQRGPRQGPRGHQRHRPSSSPGVLLPRRPGRHRATSTSRSSKQVELQMRSKDVIHDFYVVQFRVKEDVVPGITDERDLQPEQARHLPGRSARSSAAWATASCARGVIVRCRGRVPERGWTTATAKVKAATAKNSAGGGASAPATTTAPAAGTTTAP